MNKALSIAIQKSGGQTPLAKALSELCGKKIIQSHITTWLHKNKKGTPPEYCVPVERITGVPREQLRPDIDWGRKIKPKPEQVRG